MVAGTPKSLLQYIPTLLNVIDETLHLKCKEGLELSANLLSNILLVYSTTYPINYYDSPPCFDHTSKTSIPLRVSQLLYFFIYLLFSFRIWNNFVFLENSIDINNVKKVY